MPAQVVGKVQIGGSVVPQKRVSLLEMYPDAMVKATAVQMRITAYGVKDYIIDKVLAQRIDPAGRPMVFRPRAQYPDEAPPEPEQQQAYEKDVTIVRKPVYLPPRESDPATIERIPFRVFRRFPLSPRYKERKIQKRQDPRTFIATGDYLRGIVVRQRYAKGEGVTYVVTMANRRHRVSNIWLHRLALIMEFGTRSYQVPLFGNKNNMATIRLPPRPHWRPAYKKMQEALENVGPQAHARALREVLSGLQ